MLVLSNNIQRHAILQVFKKSQPHLKKVINVEETIRRISPMLQSNDPLARAITLRVLGGMATIVSDRIDVYHNVIHSLDSSEAMEVSAAVYAADMICARSQRFCAIISGKLAFMVRDTLKTPLPLRRRLIRIFGHMFEDITLARLARKTCMDILELNQDTEYTVNILRTLTKLASHSLVDVNQQIDLLLQRAKDSSNSEPGIRRISLICLGSLAQKNIEFSHEQVQAIFDIALKSEDEKTTLKAMLTLHKIFGLTSAMTSISLLDSGTSIMKGYIQACIQILERSFLTLPSTPSASSASSGSRLVVLECYSVLAAILPYYRQLEAAGLITAAESTFHEAVGKVTQSMEQFLLSILSRGGRLSKLETTQSRMVLSSLVALTLEGGSGIGGFITTLLEWINTYKESSTILAKALLRIARLQPRKLYAFQDVVMACLENYVEAPDTQTFILVFRALLEFSILHHTPRTALTASFESRVTTLIEKFGRVDMLERYTRNHWDLYQLARYSLQTGWSSLAIVALRNQEKLVSSVSTSLWLTTMQTVALIESSLQTTIRSGGQESSGQLNLCSQKQMYTKVISYLEELEAHQVNRSFHLQFSELRRQYFDTCQSTVGTLQLLSISLEINRQQDRAQQWHTTGEIALYRCADKFNYLAHQYTLLRAFVSSTPASSESNSSSTKVDQHSDGAIEVLQTMCLILAYAIQRVAKILDRTGASSSDKQTKNSSETESEFMDEDVFDVDPLLIPLLYMQSQHQEQHDQMQEDTTAGSKTVLEVFKVSTRLTLGYIDDNLTGNDIDAVEKGISIVRQLITGYISYPVPIPQEFFVSTRSPVQEQSLIG
ncbi:Integrator complex subunit 7 [Mortierella sp. AM989]|nr:Integrator complex subunit 7 [Mortierella sp. AM989]